MKLLIVISVCLTLSTTTLLSQEEAVLSTAINGTYHLLEAERGMNNGQTKTKIFEYAEHNGKKLLAISACEKCMPAIYSYQEADSKDLETLVFYNAMGLYVFAYDHESFVMIMPSPDSPEDWTNFAFSNFYSKSEAKVSAMTKDKIKLFVQNL